MPGWMGFTGADDVMNFLYRGTPIDIGGTLWMRLLVAPSSRAGGGTETTFGGYARKAFPRDGTIFIAAGSAGRLTNGVVIEIALATSLGNGDLVWFDFVDTPSGAFTKLYHGGPISPAKAIVVGKTVKFRVGALVLTV
jgi:hypothetical protein